MVPMLQCGLLRWNFALAMSYSPLFFVSRKWGIRAALNQAPPLERCLRLSKLLLDLLRDVRRHFVIVRELHRVLGAALAERTQLVDVAEHVGERHVSLDNLGVAAAVGALDLPAPA